MSAPEQTIDLSALLGSRKRANEVIDKIATASTSIESYNAVIHYLERRLAASRSTVEIGMASAAILLALAAISNVEWTDCRALVPGLLAVFALVLTLRAAGRAVKDEYRITKLQVLHAAEATELAEPTVLGKLWRLLGF